MWNFKRLNTFDEELWLEHLNNAEVSHVFFHPILIKVWLDTYKPIRNIEPIYVEATSDDGNTALMPLVLWKRNWKNAFIHLIVPIGYSDFDYHDPIFKRRPQDDELSSYWDGLIGFLKQYNADEIVFDGIRTEMTDNIQQWQKIEISPNLDISNMKDGDDLLSFFSSNLRKNTQRRIRRLNEKGNMQFKIFESADEVPPKIWNHFMSVHSNKWPNAYKAPGFHNNLLRNCSPNGPVHFSTLLLEDTPISWHLGFEFKGVFYYYMSTGNTDYAIYSPAKIHLYYMILRAIHKKFRLYDHLRGDETYKSGMSNGCTYVNTLIVTNSSLGSLLKHYVLKLRKIIK